MSHRLPLAIFLAAALTLAAALPASAATRRPDLRPAAVRGVPSASQLPGGVFNQFVRIRNLGRRTARSSVAGLFLSTNRRRDRGDTRLGTRRTGKIRRRRAVRRRIRARLPGTVTPGVYRLIACADIRRRVRERRERNNCRLARRRLTIVAAPVTPPPVIPPGQPPVDPPVPAPEPGPPNLALHLDDGYDWGFQENDANESIDVGDVVTLTLRMAAGVPGAAGYDRTEVPDEAFIGGTDSVLAFAEEDDDQKFFGLPFAAPFAGVPYTSASASTNTWLSFGSPASDYWDDIQAADFRGIDEVAGEFYRGVMPYWLDADLGSEGTRGPGEVKVVDPGDGERVAVQWDVNSHDDIEGQPRRTLQALLFKDGRIRFDYAPSSRVESDGDTDLAFVGLSPGIGADALDVIGADVEEPPGTAILYTPRAVSPRAAPAGTVSVTLPYGSEFDSADSGCELVEEPTEQADGLVECDTPEIPGGTTITRRVRFVMHEHEFSPGNPPNVDYEAVWSAGGDELEDADELDKAGDYEDTTSTTDIAYAGADATPDPTQSLLFEVDGAFADDTGRRPVLTISWDADLRMIDTELPGCEEAPGTFGPAEVECLLPSGTDSFTNQTVTFETESSGTKTVDVELVADNADAGEGSGAINVVP